MPAPPIRACWRQARDKLVQAAKDAGIALKQTFVKEGRQLAHKAGRYAHAKQFGCMRKVIGRQRTVLGRLFREVERKISPSVMNQALQATLKQATILMQVNQVRLSDVFVDLVYRGVDADTPTVAVKHRGEYKSLSASDKRMLKRRQAIEPIIGLLKQDHRMDRCHLTGDG